MSYFFFFNDTATTEIYTLSLHDALPIFADLREVFHQHLDRQTALHFELAVDAGLGLLRSEEHTSELQSQSNLVCRLLLEKKKFAKVATTATGISGEASKTANESSDVSFR